MCAYQIWDEAKTLFAPGSKRHPDVSVAAKDLALADVSLGKFLTSKYSLWFDLRTTDDDRLHGNSRRIDEGVTIQITKTAEAAGPLNVYLFLIMDAELDIEDGRFDQAAFNQRLINQRLLDLRRAHAAIICGQTGCGKTVFILDLLEGSYQGFFRHIVVLCPTIRHNKTYQQRPWIWTDPEVYVLDPGERLHDYLRAFYQAFVGEPTLYIIDDCSAMKALTRTKDMLSELAFSGRHTDPTVCVLTQKYNTVLKDLREQTRWVALFQCKDRDSFEDCLRENDVIPTREQRALVRQQLAETRHAVLVLNTDQPALYGATQPCLAAMK